MALPNHILITGSSGTIGTRLAEKLLSLGKKITGIDRQPNKWNQQINDLTVQADLLDPKSFNSISTAPDTIIHLAANARVYDLVTNPQLAFENIQTTFNVLEYARKNQVPRIIFASSREVYGNQTAAPSVFPTAEPATHIDHIESAYSASKFSGEALVHAYQNCYNLDYVIFRFSNVYGMYDDSDRVVPLFIQKSLHHEPLTIFGSQKLLDFTYIDDAIAGITSALTNFEQAKNSTYNLAYGEPNSLIQLAEFIQSEIKKLKPEIQLPEILIQPTRTGEVMTYIADLTSARQKLNYTPQTPLKSGITKTVQWYLGNYVDLS